jgi:hypothetical protein
MHCHIQPRPMLHNDILKYVLFPLLGPHDLCACSQVSKQWHTAAMHVAKKQYSEYMLQHYACAGLYDAYIAINKPAPQAINLAITFGRDAFVQRCIHDGHIPEVTLSNHNSIEAELLRDYLNVSITMSRDNIFTMLYMRGGWYFPNLLVTAAQKGNLHACKQMFWKHHPNLMEAIRVAHSGSKYHIVRYLDRGDGYGDDLTTQNILASHMRCYGEDEDVDDDTAGLELFS